MRLFFWLRIPFLLLAGIAPRAGPILPRQVYATTPGPRRTRALKEMASRTHEAAVKRRRCRSC
jgi:hypothetical protein